jgi:autotransporter-associated beta strand protein
MSGLLMPPPNHEFGLSTDGLIFGRGFLRGFRIGVACFTLLVLGQPSKAQAAWVPGDEYRNQPALSIIRVHNPDSSHPSAYDQGYSGLGIRIGIIDSGINPDHVEFTNAIVAGMTAGSEPVWSGISNFSGNLYDSNDDDGGEGHGTHVASIAAARLDGVPDSLRPGNMQGVAYNASLVIAGFDPSNLDLDITDPAQLANMDNQWSAAFDYVVAQGARVINNSWGDTSTGVDPELESLTFLASSPRTVNAMRQALASGAVIVFANGNDRDNPGEGMNPGAPTALPSYDPSMAAYGAWIAVTATGLETAGSLESRMASYANYCGVAAAYCIAAPGGDSPPANAKINGAKSGVRNSSNIYTDNDEYVGIDGTSMAAPMVTGAVALVAEKYPWMTNRNLVATILTTASHAHDDPSPIYGRGLLDVNRAINGPAIFEQTFEAHLPAGVKSEFSNVISGDHGLIKRGEGLLRLSANNTFAGPVEIRAGVLQADHDVSLGNDQSQVLIFDGTLRFGADFVTVADGVWHKPIAVGSTGATIDTNGNTVAYAGGLIDAASEDGSLGTLSFVGTPMSIAADLQLNANWNADLTISGGVSLSGRGAVLGELTLDGTYRPGNSPGTVYSPGSLRMVSDAVLEIDIDGRGTSDGAGNFDRLVFTSADSQFTADGTLDVLLRGISAPANNDYSPALGQGFDFVIAPGGVSGSFDFLQQPTDGLLPGMQMDVVYGTNQLTLYVTPASYANLSAAAVASNTNRDGLGRILQAIRPAAGVRELDPLRKTLFDGLAPQTAASLPVVMDQLAGVSYVQLIGLAQQNTAFLLGQMASAPGLNRWGRLAAGATEATDQSFQVSDPGAGSGAWGRVIGRHSLWRGDGTIGTTTDTLGGVALGTQRQVSRQTNLGFAMAYGNSSSQLPSNMGSGSAQNLQLMTYGSMGFEDGYFVQGGIGLGGSIISANRSLSLVNANYSATIKTANMAANLMFGQFVQRADWRYEWQLGLNYLGMRTFGFMDSGGPGGLSVSGQATDNTSVQPTVGLTAGIPFQANQTPWQLLASVDYAYELADNRAYLNTVVLNEDLRIQSSDIGRSRLTIGLALSANLSENSVFLLSINNQFASNWSALSAFANLSLRF